MQIKENYVFPVNIWRKNMWITQKACWNSVSNWTCQSKDDEPLISVFTATFQSNGSKTFCWAYHPIYVFKMGRTWQNTYLVSCAAVRWQWRFTVSQPNLCREEQSNRNDFVLPIQRWSCLCQSLFPEHWFRFILCSCILIPPPSI